MTQVAQGAHRNTAEVETLTAQVRVLMVGSRQITQSVAAQLDRVEPDELAPAFGRVKVKSEELAIGRRRSTSELVLAAPCTWRTRVAAGNCEFCGGYGHDRRPLYYKHHWQYCDDHDFQCSTEYLQPCDFSAGVWLSPLPLIVLAGLR